MPEKSVVVPNHELLKKYFDRKRKSSPGFSLRALAGRLDVSASFLSRVMSGKKPVPAELLPRLAKALDVEPEMLVPKTPAKKEKAPPAAADWSIADIEATQILRNWYNVPILELLTLSNFDGSAAAISRRLKLSKATTEIALRELEMMGLIQNKEGRYVKTESRLRFTSSKSTTLIRKFHDEMLEKSQFELRNATTEDEFQNRLITGITISASPEKIQEAKAKLADFLHELANDIISSPGTEVYHLSAQLFPLTKGD